MEVYFIRHGESEYNVIHKINSNKKIPVHITKKGIKQAEIAAKKLSKIKFDAIYSSEFLRCKETAEIINKYHKLKIKSNKRMNEWLTGCEGKSSVEFETFIIKNGFNAKKPKGESFVDVKKRTLKFLFSLKKLKTKNKYKNILVVTHDELVKSIYGYKNNLSDKQTFLKGINNAEIIKVKI